MMEMIILIIMMFVLFKILGFVFKIVGSVLGFVFGLIGYVFLGILAVGAFGMAMIFLPAIVVLGLLGITGIAKGVI